MRRTSDFQNGVRWTDPILRSTPRQSLPSSKRGMERVPLLAVAAISIHLHRLRMIALPEYSSAAESCRPQESGEPTEASIRAFIGRWRTLTRAGPEDRCPRVQPSSTTLHAPCPTPHLLHGSDRDPTSGVPFWRRPHGRRSGLRRERPHRSTLSSKDLD